MGVLKDNIYPEDNINPEDNTDSKKDIDSEIETSVVSNIAGNII